MFKRRETIWEEQKRFLMYGAPTCMLIVSPFGLSFITIMFAGWESKEVLSGVALGNTTYNIFMMSCMCGFCSLLSTYGPQVYGAGFPKAYLGMVVQKVFLIGFTVFLVILGPYLKSLELISWVLRTVTYQLQKHDLVSVESTLSVDTASNTNFHVIQEIASEFISKTWMWALLDFSMRLLTKYLSLQYRSTAVYASSALLLLLHIFFSYLLTVHSGCGMLGLVYAGTLSRTISLLLLLLYCACVRKQLAWGGFTTRVLENWREMIILGFSASVNVFSEMGMYELAIFLSQFRGVNYLTSVVISFQIITLIYSTTYGVCYAAAAMIGTALGQGDADKVTRYIKLSVVNTVVESVVLACVCYLCRYRLVALFTTDPHIIASTADMLWIVLLEVPLDHLQTLFSYGVLVTVGCQVFVATTLAIICYGICTPAIVGFIFFTELGGEGVLYGMALFVALSCIVCGSKVLSLDIDKEILSAQHRVEDSIIAEKTHEQEDDTDESLLESGDRDTPPGLLTDFYTTDSALTSFGHVKNNYIKLCLIFGLMIGWVLYFLIVQILAS